MPNSKALPRLGLVTDTLRAHRLGTGIWGRGRQPGHVRHRGRPYLELPAAAGAAERLSPVIIVMCGQGRLIRWKGSGGWRSARPRYRRLTEALPGIRLDSWEETAAVRALTSRYVRRYGPVSESDVAWWMGLSRAAVRDALASAPDLVSVTVVGSPGSFLIHEADIARLQHHTRASARQVCLLPVLDPYLQGYRQRERCVDPRYQPFVVDRGGNVTSVILIGGRAAGVWDLVTKPSPELRLFFLAPPDTQTRRAIHAQAAELADTLTDGSAQVVERGQMTPLTRGTAGSFLSPLKDAR